MRKVIAAALLCGLIGLAARPVLAQGTVVLGTEDPSTGFVGAIATSAPPIMVASDGEGPFDPFGAGYDTSDGIQFPVGSGWQLVGGAPGWVQVPNSLTWVLPADLTSIGGGVENGTTFEPVGEWLWPGVTWNQGTPEFQEILEGDGSLGDMIHVFNDARGANVTFASDPEVSVPEPGSLMFLGAGLVAVALRLRRKA